MKYHKLQAGETTGTYVMEGVFAGPLRSVFAHELLIGISVVGASPIIVLIFLP